jgi:hypothetical protein
MAGARLHRTRARDIRNIRLGGRVAKFPGILGEIAEAAGEEAAIAVARAAGGRFCYLPGIATLRAGQRENNWLVRAVGMEAAVKIALACSPRRGVWVDMPLGPLARDFRIREAIDKKLLQGKSVNEIARALKTTRRSVYRRKAKIRENNGPDAQAAPDDRTARDAKTRGIEK